MPVNNPTTRSHALRLTNDRRYAKLERLYGDRANVEGSSPLKFGYSKCFTPSSAQGRAASAINDRLR